MDAYVSEQEQVEQIRRWWKNNGTALMLGLALGLGGLGAYRYWDATQSARAESASQNYEQLIEMAAAQKLDDAMKAGHAIIESYPGTVYAKLSGLLIAKMAVEKNDYPQAKAEDWRLEVAGQRVLMPERMARCTPDLKKALYGIRNELKEAGGKPNPSEAPKSSPAASSTAASACRATRCAACRSTSWRGHGPASWASPNGGARCASPTTRRATPRARFSRSSRS